LRIARIRRSKNHRDFVSDKIGDPSRETKKGQQVRWQKGGKIGKKSDVSCHSRGEDGGNKSCKGEKKPCNLPERDHATPQ